MGGNGFGSVAVHKLFTILLRIPNKLIDLPSWACLSYFLVCCCHPSPDMSSMSPLENYRTT